MRMTSSVQLLFLAAVCAPAYGANLVTFNITAVVDSVDDPFGVINGNILPGDALTGVLQYDLDLPDSDPDPNYGSFSADPPGDNFINGSNAGSSFFETILFFDIYTENDPLFSDSIEFFASGDTTPSLLAHPLVDYVDVDILLVDDDQTALINNAPPSTLNLDDFEIAFFSLSGDSFDADTGMYFTPFYVMASITDISRVPEPAGLVFIALGLSLAAIRRRS